MNFQIVFKSASLIVTSAVLLSACSTQPLKAPEPPPFVKKVADDWPSYQAERIAEKARYIAGKQVAFDWFADFAFSETDGTPYIVLRLLPVIAPELWGSEENFLDVVGLFNDTRQNGYPMPRGIGISRLNRTDPTDSTVDIDYTSFTCGACHIGRVRKENGEIGYIDGGVNSEFNIVAYRVKIYQTLQKIIGDETNKAKQQELITDAFLTALKKAEASSDTFFYRNYKKSWRHFDAVYEKAQIALFRKRAAELISTFSTRAIDNYTGYGALLDKNYDGFQARSLEGFPGMADATGIFTANSYNDVKKGFFTGLFASLVLPSSPGITDFMSVWEQHARKAEWDESHKSLINGGGQWNGNIPIPIYRNLAAQSTLGLKNLDLRVSAFSVNLLDHLPATVYPFNVDIALAKKGKKLFAQNCAQCHQPHNGMVYNNLNVNLDRSYVVNWLIRPGGINGFNETCSATTTILMNGVKTQPCAEFNGVSLAGKKDLIISPNKQHHGYNARPLNGIWAQAPYLHNGSVPTVYHLLVPDERPASFVKSRLEYDQKKLGFAWTKATTLSIPDNSYIFDTKSFPTFSNVGHDKDIKENGQHYKLDWSNDKAGAMAIIEYLKTL
ncbi:MAG: cytochrome C [Candidatus Electrothrix sp. GM3_4]|nr:cytochrome C [Candidatus Electrothrix sp. GM3_4]